MCVTKSTLKNVIYCNFGTDVVDYVSSVEFIANDTLYTKKLDFIKSFVVPQESHQLVKHFISTLTELNILLTNCIFHFPNL